MEKKKEKKKDLNTEAEAWDSGNFLEGWGMLGPRNNLIDTFRSFIWFCTNFLQTKHK